MVRGLIQATGNSEKHTKAFKWKIPHDFTGGVKISSTQRSKGPNRDASRAHNIIISLIYNNTKKINQHSENLESHNILKKHYHYTLGRHLISFLFAEDPILEYIVDSSNTLHLLILSMTDLTERVS